MGKYTYFAAGFAYGFLAVMLGLLIALWLLQKDAPAPPPPPKRSRVINVDFDTEKRKEA